MGEINIVDVIITPQNQIFVVVDRMPSKVYHRDGNRLISRDSGFYDCLTIEPGSKDAFGGQKFTVQLDDGSEILADGQIWASFHKDLIGEPTIQVGVATLEKLKECYVFFSGLVSKQRLENWLSSNKHSTQYLKHDPRSTLEWLDEVWAKYPSDKPICAARARTLRKRGVTIRVNKETGQRGWSPRYERRKAAIIKIQTE
ncbi:hypothetical protein [Chromobacterium haemolyticum]|uniref:hypothetical protein n=1 Tax=Chromobacterium haemolyticum TaxID=394935 RepID=UPI00307E0350